MINNIEKIKSKQNAKYKSWQKLLKRKYRNKESKYIIEGVNLIEEALKCNAALEAIIIREGYIEEFNQCNSNYKDGLIKLIDNVNEIGYKMYELDSLLFSDLTQTEKSRGIIAVVSKKEYSLDTITNIIDKGTNFIVIDRLQDPGNMGTIIRTADAAGYAGLIILKGSCDPFDPKVVRSATGSLFRLPLYYIDNENELFDFVQRTGYEIVATGFDTDNYYFDISLKNNKLVVIGNEGQGISDKIMSCADHVVKIPMAGNIESLNASVAASIIMYQTVQEKMNTK